MKIGKKLLLGLYLHKQQQIMTAIQYITSCKRQILLPSNKNRTIYGSITYMVFAFTNRNHGGQKFQWLNRFWWNIWNFFDE